MHRETVKFQYFKHQWCVSPIRVYHRGSGGTGASRFLADPVLERTRGVTGAQQATVQFLQGRLLALYPAQRRHAHVVLDLERRKLPTSHCESLTREAEFKGSVFKTGYLVTWSSTHLWSLLDFGFLEKPCDPCFFCFETLEIKIHHINNQPQ